jgi:hypothetical protein
MQKRSASVRLAAFVAVSWCLLGSQAALAQAVSTDKTNYAPYEPVTITWSGAHASGVWVGVGKPNGMMFSTSEPYKSLSNYNGAVTNGSVRLDGLTPGRYEARVLIGIYGQQTVLGRVPITVGAAGAAPSASSAAAAAGPTFAATKQSYEPFEPIEVSWSGIKMPTGWIGIVKRGTKITDTSRIQQTKAFTNYDGSKSAGTATFDGNLPGEYEVVLVGGSYDKPYVYKRVLISVKE